MSEEHDEPTWFPRELRDHLSAEVAHYGFATCWITLCVAQRALLSGGDMSTAAGMVTGFLLVLVVMGVCWWATTRYRMLGLAVPASTALFVGLGSSLLLGRAGFLEAFLIWGGAFVGGLPCARFVTHARDADSMRAVREPFRRIVTTYRLVVSVPLLLQSVVVFVYGIGTIAGWAIISDPWFQLLTKWYFFALSAVLCVWCWLRLFRPFFELLCEVAFWFLYAVRTAGPGLKAVPPFGPVLVIANHAAWFDPCFLGKILPRPITPMMTESFYKIWFLRPILKYVFRVIVVPERPVRHNAPELQQAIEALGRGECVVLFPEGYLRRKEEVPLRRFGQGVWHILHACPDTPVICCWIEGSWGSKFSWKGGPPTKNKKMDFRLPINIGVSAPEVVPVDILTDGMRTRIHLMNRVSAARAHLGLPPLPAFELPKVCEPGEESVQSDAAS